MNVLDIALTRGYFGRENSQLRMFKNGDGLPEFIAIAESGRPTNSPGWSIVKITYDVDNFAETALPAPRNSILDNRSSLTYG